MGNKNKRETLEKHKPKEKEKIEHYMWINKFSSQDDHICAIENKIFLVLHQFIALKPCVVLI